MNTKRENCFCGNALSRVSAQDHDGKIPLGYYCKKCKIILDLDVLPMVPYRVPFHEEPDPTIGVIRDLFPIHWKKVILKMLENPNVRSLPEKMMRELLIKDTGPQLEKEFDRTVRTQEMKEANSNQPNQS